MHRLAPLDRHRIAHYLNCRGRLHSPGVFRLFCTSAVDAKTLRADPCTREYVGFTRQIQGHWNKDFLFAHLSDPALATAAEPAPSTGDLPVAAVVGAQEQQLREALAAINKLRPKFVVVTGNMTAAAFGDAEHAAQTEVFRRAMARLSDTIPALYVPGPHDVGETPTAESLRCYRAKFGADYYGVWFGGLRCLVLNSPLMVHPQGAPEESAEQDLWLAEEIEQAKLCSAAIKVFAFHPWFLESLGEEDAESSSQKR